jgi:hypothetical protein
MNQDKKLDRKDFLTSAVAACAAVSFGACSDEGDDGGTGGKGGMGGMDSKYTCTADTMEASNGNNHSHPLTIPGSDIERGYQDAPYILEDGGTGHTHTLELAAYEWAYLAGGSPIEAPSSTDAGHSHNVKVNCVMD